MIYFANALSLGEIHMYFTHLQGLTSPELPIHGGGLLLGLPRGKEIALQAAFLFGIALQDAISSPTKPHASLRVLASPDDLSMEATGSLDYLSEM